jgi:prolyl-tRNA editing enzyme YbaK/EbsC (Cys-tRNA(Pro) deacylase)
MLAYDYPEFALGAVPPVGGDRVDLVVIDKRTADCDRAVFEEGVHSLSLRLRTADLMAVANASVAESPRIMLVAVPYHLR